MFGWGGKTMGGMFNKPAEMPGPPSWLPYARRRRQEGGLDQDAGGQVVNGPMEVPGELESRRVSISRGGCLPCLAEARGRCRRRPQAPAARKKPRPRKKGRESAPSEGEERPAKKAVKKAAKAAKRLASRPRGNRGQDVEENRSSQGEERAEEKTGKKR